jgi:Uma2 family endonuclease
MVDLKEIELQNRRFTYQDMLMMEEAGVIGEDERLELINGTIISMSPMRDPHAFVVDELGERFIQTFSAVARVRIQNPLRLSADLDDNQLPSPDVVIFRRGKMTHPLPHDVFFLVEVSDSTLQKDRMIKLPLYAQALIPEVWLVNLLEKHIEVYTGPSETAYLTQEIRAFTEAFAPKAFPKDVHAWLPEQLIE